MSKMVTVNFDEMDNTVQEEYADTMVASFPFLTFELIGTRPSKRTSKRSE